MDTPKRLFLKSIQPDDVVDLYFLHTRYFISPSTIAELIKYFSEKGIIKLSTNETSGIDCRLTDFGKKWVLENPNYLYSEQIDKHWKSIPKDFLCEKLSPDIEYIPSDKEIKSFLGTST
ncbi:MAG: hypothetical protein AB2770_13230 [Candidatus Thiodiazotropha taylori]